MRIHCLSVEQMHSTLLAGTTRYVICLWDFLYALSFCWIYCDYAGNSMRLSFNNASFNSVAFILTRFRATDLNVEWISEDCLHWLPTSLQLLHVKSLLLLYIALHRCRILQIPAWGCSHSSESFSACSLIPTSSHRLVLRFTSGLACFKCLYCTVLNPKASSQDAWGLSTAKAEKINVGDPTDIEAVEVLWHCML